MLRHSTGPCAVHSHLLDCVVWWATHVSASSVLLCPVHNLQCHTGNCYTFLSDVLLILNAFLCQGLYILVVYLFVSLHTLTWKHKHYPMKEELEPAILPEEPEFVDNSYPSMYGSQQHLNPQVSHLRCTCSLAVSLVQLLFQSPLMLLSLKSR